MFFRCALVKWSQTFLWLAAVKTRSIWLTVDDMGACCIQKHNKSSVVYLCLNWNSTLVVSSMFFSFFALSIFFVRAILASLVSKFVIFFNTFRFFIHRDWEKETVTPVPPWTHSGSSITNPGRVSCTPELRIAEYESLTWISCRVCVLAHLN